MQVEDRRRDVRLGEHIVDLAAVVRLMVEEVRHQEVHWVGAGPPFVVEVVDLPSQEPFLDTGREGLDARVFLLPRLPQLLEVLVEDRVEVRRSDLLAGKASQIRSPTITWFSVPWMLPKKEGLRALSSTSPRRAHAPYSLRLTSRL